MTSMSIRPAHYKVEANLFEHTNVLWAKDQPPADYTSQTCFAMYCTLKPLVESKPHWTFRAVHRTAANDSKAYIATAFAISEGDEALGTVDITYKGRDYKIRVTNERINAKRDRGGAYHTDDPDRATLAIRKNFFPLDKSERINKALSAASNIISSEHNQKESHSRYKRNEMWRDCTEFCKAHLEQYLTEFPAMREKYDVAIAAEQEYQTVKTIYEAFDSDVAVVVILAGTQYVARDREGIKTFTHDTLTYDMSRKIGLLKLVNDKQMVSGVGCRIDANTFVLMPEVTEGASDEN